MADTVGLTFNETMRGPLALGATDPVEGEKQGRAAGSELAMHATIDIEDLERFLDDADHAAKLSGTLDFTPWGEGLPAPRGVFNLFKPSGEEDLRLMVYELAFAHEGQDYYMAGQKDVRNDPILDLWKQTTTLYTRIHKGADKSGPVVGAGVLTLGVTDLIRLVSTLHATGGTPVQRAEAVARFGKFFMGQLWDTYVKHSPVPTE